MTKEVREILNDIETFGECFIGTIEVQGMKAVKRYNKVRKAYEKENNGMTLAYDSETGIVWQV